MLLFNIIDKEIEVSLHLIGMKSMNENDKVAASVSQFVDRFSVTSQGYCELLIGSNHGVFKAIWHDKYYRFIGLKDVLTRDPASYVLSAKEILRAFYPEVKDVIAQLSELSLVYLIDRLVVIEKPERQTKYSKKELALFLSCLLTSHGFSRDTLALYSLNEKHHWIFCITFFILTYDMSLARNIISEGNSENQQYERSLARLKSSQEILIFLKKSSENKYSKDFIALLQSFDRIMMSIIVSSFSFRSQANGCSVDCMEEIALRKSDALRNIRVKITTMGFLSDISIAKSIEEKLSRKVSSMIFHHVRSGDILYYGKNKAGEIFNKACHCWLEKSTRLKGLLNTVYVRWGIRVPYEDLLSRREGKLKRCLMEKEPRHDNFIRFH